MQSTTLKDLQYLASKLEYVQSKVAAVLNGSKSEPSSKHLMKSPPQHQHNKAAKLMRPHLPNIHNLSARSSPHKPASEKKKKTSNKRHSNPDRCSPNQNRVLPYTQQHSPPQRKQLDIGKYLSHTQPPIQQA
eukprot:CAMPEP_0202714458 /NCGR_PEP_ID=MMETSP1385-20130828/73719_1 /ASSEMBLY_ACC=CAM_ASM_000861 /TAXON_ID=933848 /ORGANISM="Elphidium margaritaceum" /LENGTH=131 /DNA_ID=CAMNT_0049375273 /DNA_START=162 /DNA_END=553 /DNA_ORIENTATION=+